ncbi:MAG: hypothetical protein SFV81_20325 [Pirellulaceae bacterium]|nr:hypothetical protein [Pirellulaceae bacterium]
MFKVLLSALVAFALVVSTPSVTSAGGGNGGGGKVKPVTTRITGAISKIQLMAGGAVKVTIGTSYYATGSAVINSTTKMRLNGVQAGVNPRSYKLGDYAEIDVQLNGIAYKIEATR